MVLSYQPEIETLKAPNVLAYSLETVVAEKFQAMIDLAEVNSRLKDFYDVYGILTNHDINEDLLNASIVATFQNRGTSYMESHPLFDPAFAEDKGRLVQWKTVLKKQKKNLDLDFQLVMKTIVERLQPIFEGLKK